MDWIRENLEILEIAYPGIEYRADGGQHWVRIGSHPISSDIWTLGAAEVAFRIPSQPGEAPYAFWVRPGLELAAGGAINNYSFPASTPWGSDWGQFSLSPTEPWQPKADIRAGPNMLNFARGIVERLRQRA